MFMFNTAASLSFNNFQNIHQDFGFRGISCHQFPTMAAMNRNVTVIWDDSQEEKVDFKPPTPPASGFHSILPVLPVDDPTGGGCEDWPGACDLGPACGAYGNIHTYETQDCLFWFKTHP